MVFLSASFGFSEAIRLDPDNGPQHRLELNTLYLGIMHSVSKTNQIPVTEQISQTL